jgi:hypothetical protein
MNKNIKHKKSIMVSGSALLSPPAFTTPKRYGPTVNLI